MVRKTRPAAPERGQAGTAPIAGSTKIGADSVPAPEPSAADQMDIIKKPGGHPPPAGTAAEAVLWNVPQFYGKRCSVLFGWKRFRLDVCTSAPGDCSGPARWYRSSVRESRGGKRSTLRFCRRRRRAHNHHPQRLDQKLFAHVRCGRDHCLCRRLDRLHQGCRPAA